MGQPYLKLRGVHLPYWCPLHPWKMSVTPNTRLCGFSDYYSIRGPALPSLWQRVRFVQGPVTVERGHERRRGPSVVESDLLLTRTVALRTLLPPPWRGTEAEGRVSGPPSRQLGTKEARRARDHFQNVPSQLQLIPYSFSAAGRLRCPPSGQT